MSTTCAALMLEAAQAHPEADAIVLPGDRATYRELADGAEQWSRLFAALETGRGEHVGILLPNGTEFMHVLFGAMLAGAVPVPINSRYRGPEIAAMAADADLRVVVTANDIGQGPSLVDRLFEAFPDLAAAESGVPLSLPEAPLLRSIIVTRGPAPAGFLHRENAAVLAAGISADEIKDRRESVRSGATGLILFTSGSTSRPKGCLLSHAAIVTQGHLLAQRYQMTNADRIWSPLPMFHVGGISPLMAIASVGGAFLSMRRFEAEAGLAMMAEERATIAFALFQTIISDLLQDPSFADHDLGAIRLMVSNFALQPPWIRDLLTACLPHAVQIGTYGLTETVASICTHSPDDDHDDRLHRLGKPLPGVEVRVLDEHGRAVAPGVVGEVVLRGPTLCSGYYKDAEKTAGALRGGWLYTGDRGSLDARGSLMFHGRLKDVLKVGGENVGALEIETVVGMHPAVKSCAAVGVPDPRLEEVPVVFVELRQGARATADQVVNFCTGKLASFKVPRRVYFVTEWPMSATKIDKPALTRRAAAGAQAAANGL